MKEKFKKFYYEHEMGFAYTMVVVGTVGAVTGIVLLKKWEDNPIVAVARRTDPDGLTDSVRVTLQNGKNHYYFWDHQNNK